MKILVQDSDGIVIIAVEEDQKLQAGDGQTVYTGVTLPDHYRDGAWTYIGGVWDWPSEEAYAKKAGRQLFPRIEELRAKHFYMNFPYTDTAIQLRDELDRANVQDLATRADRGHDVVIQLEDNSRPTIAAATFVTLTDQMAERGAAVNFRAADLKDGLRAVTTMVQVEAIEGILEDDWPPPGPVT